MRLRRTARSVAGLGLVTVTLLGVSTEAGGRTTRAVNFGADTRLGVGPETTNGMGRVEPAIAVNPRDPQNLVAGFFGPSNFTNSVSCQVALTTNGGLTWSSAGSTPLEQIQSSCADPSLAADANGNFYYAYLQVTTVSGPSVTFDILVARSTDGGRSFPSFSVAVRHDPTNAVDKPYVAVDAQPKSRFRGTLYLAYTDFEPSEQIKVVRSRDGGVTWSDPVSLGAVDPGFLDVQGGLPVVAPDGTAYVFYAEYFFAIPYTLSIKFSRSTDGGRTWSRPADVASGLPSPGDFTIKNADPGFGVVAGPGLLVNSFPTAASAPDGTLYVAWVDLPQGSCVDLNAAPQPCTNTDVRLSVSRNGGKSWTAPVKVSDETNQSDQFFPWLATHPDGLLSIVWLDKRLDPDNENFDAFYTNTYDGVHFLPNLRLSTATSIVGRAARIGDYNGIAGTADAVFPVWVDLRFNNPAIFTARGTLAP